MIYITGDTHGNHDTSKLFLKSFPDGKSLSMDDYVIITGDFGGIWYGDKRDDATLEFYEEKKYMVLFVDGNHENFDALNKYPISEWNGGKVHKIRDNIFHLMRGQVFEIDSKKFFTFGGGVSIDKAMRMPYVSWWPQEEASYEEINEALDNLEKHKNKVDYVITHAAPESIVRNELCQIHTLMKVDCATEKFLNEIYHNLEFKMWFCGHYHMDAWIKSCKMQVLYHQIIKLAPGYPIASRRIF